jgi:hypothetical protein
MLQKGYHGVIVGSTVTGDPTNLFLDQNLQINTLKS